MSKNLGEKFPIGPNSPAFIIAEVADTHFGDMNVARSLLLELADAGVDAVKFQHHIPEQEMLPSVPQSRNMREPLFEFLARNSLSLDQHRELATLAQKKGVRYLCTPFSRQAASEIEPLVDFFKVGSGEFNDYYLLEHLVSFGKPLILSTGMASESDVLSTINFLLELGSPPFALLHCVSGYPPRPTELTIGWLPKLKELTPSQIIGYSSHTQEISTAVAAVALGAKIIEKHVMPENAPAGPDSDVSLNVTEFARLVEAVRTADAASGDKKAIQASELEIAEWAHRSVVARRTISSGQTATEADLCTKRPGTGVPAKHWREFIGRVASEDIPQNTMLAWEMFATDASG